LRGIREPVSKRTATVPNADTQEVSGFAVVGAELHECLCVQHHSTATPDTAQLQKVLRLKQGTYASGFDAADNSGCLGGNFNIGKAQSESEDGVKRLMCRHTYGIIEDIRLANEDVDVRVRVAALASAGSLIRAIEHHV
jgi:hypothetical protein